MKKDENSIEPIRVAFKKLDLDKQRLLLSQLLDEHTYYKDSEFKKFKEKFNSEDLDDFVLDLKSDEASDINNSGIDSQLEYMLESGGIKYMRSILGEEE